MKRQIPFALVFIFGIFMIFQDFVPHEYSEWVYEFLLDWIYIIGILALALGIWSLLRVSVDKIKTKKPYWGYSYVTLFGLFVMMIFGFTAQRGDSWGLYPLFVLAKKLVSKFESFNITHINREDNQEADELAKKATGFLM